MPYQEDFRPTEVAFQHEEYLVQEWTIPIHDDAMMLAPWAGMFDEAAKVANAHPDATASVHFIDPDLMVIRVTHPTE